MKKYIPRTLCLLLALLMAFCAMPLAASAEESGSGADAVTNTITVKAVCYTGSSLETAAGTYSTVVYSNKESITVDAATFGSYITYGGKIYEFRGVSYGGSTQNSVTLSQPSGTHSLTVLYVPHTHNFVDAYNRIYHWKSCACGKTKDKAHHVDPATDEDKVCTCGYKFSDNAELTTLWLTNVRYSPRFTRDTTDYTGEVVSYLDVTETQITARTFDALATMELPQDLTIREGSNTFQITVTAEDKTTTKTYTVQVVKPAKVDGAVITPDADGITVTPTVTFSQKVASAEITEAIIEKLLELAEPDESTQISLDIPFKTWNATQAQVTIPAAALTAIAEKSEADMVITTIYGDAALSHDDLCKQAEAGKDIVVTIDKDGTFNVDAQ